MSFFTDHPRARWTLPVAAAGVIGLTVVTVNQAASADSGLPSRTAAQLLADVRSAHISGLSGTVVQTSDLGLPDLAGLGGSGRPGSASSSLTSLVSGTHTWRVWLDGPTRQRLALIGSNGESDVIHNGKDVWLWSSSDKTAVHHELSAAQLKSKTEGKRLPTQAPRTPDEAASAALALMGKDTAVTTSGTASVAGRSAYELVLTPKDKATLVRSVRIAIDSKEHVPLRVQVYSTKLTNPAFEVGFTAVDFAQPDARQFQFTPPAGTKVTESGQLTPPKYGPGTNPAPGKPSADLPSQTQGEPKVVGSGWDTVIVAPFSLPTAQGKSSGAGADSMAQLSGILKALPKVSGTWGSGHVLQGTLFSIILTDDGRAAVGAVAPDRLYEALAAK